MASYQYVYHMDQVSKTYPGGKKVFENIRLNFLPGVKIGVVGVNGSGKSSLRSSGFYRRRNRDDRPRPRSPRREKARTGV